ncbi:MAG: hypothetical protein JWM57_2595 [Phycisphaerales bacterium]|nr:hypothetical protein [Phycisphaerales bacterium]
MKHGHPEDKSKSAPLLDTVVNLNHGLLAIVDAAVAIPHAAAAEIAIGLHGKRMLRERGIDNVNQHSVSGMLDRLSHKVRNDNKRGRE